MRRRAVVHVCVLLTAVLAAGSLLLSAEPGNETQPKRKFEVTKKRLQRGRYLVEGVAHCFACHSEANWATDTLPVKGRKGAGGRFPEQEIPFPVYVPNITPDPETGAGKWDDEVFERALRQGIGNDGRTLFPLMPYHSFRQLSDEDLASIIVYVRSIPPVRNKIPTPTIPDEVRKNFKPLPPVAGPVPEPDWNNPVKRGEYLVTIGNCEGCHTPTDQTGQPIPSLRLAGGARLKGPWGEASSANLTPDPSGISYYDEKLFLQTLRTGHVKARKINNIMLWRYFRNMTDQDLKAIFAYLRTVKPVQHRVDNAEAVADCKLCRGKHGAGRLNDVFVAETK